MLGEFQQPRLQKHVPPEATRPFTWGIRKIVDVIFIYVIVKRHQETGMVVTRQGQVHIAALKAGLLEQTPVTGRRIEMVPVSLFLAPPPGIPVRESPGQNSDPRQTTVRVGISEKTAQAQAVLDSEIQISAR